MSNQSGKRTKENQISRLINRAGLSLIIAGLIIGGFSLLVVWRAQHSTVRPVPLSQILKNDSTQNDGLPTISGTPVHIAIPSVNINVNVIPGYYYPKTKSWTLSPVNAQYAVVTAKANNKHGDTFIYGHALMNVFGRLPAIQSHAQAIVTTDNGHTFTYSFKGSTVTTPNDTTLFNYQGRPVLILQTCSGAWYQNRQLFLFNLEKVS